MILDDIYVPPNTAFKVVQENIALFVLSINDSSFEGIALNTNVKPGEKLSTGFVSYMYSSVQQLYRIIAINNWSAKFILIT